MSPLSCVALAVRLADARSHVARGSTGSRGELCVWMCEAHNRVNRLLGKAEFSCELSQLDMRWCGACIIFIAIKKKSMWFIAINKTTQCVFFYRHKQLHRFLSR